ncbi:hypothetical protein SETIT_4G065300v2 [Setaria italica]|uniref:DUF569 domain-containing protein n=1 Tax=Setaria italica TaxID=4555 RepID=A0A368QTE9_SETIT|nr:uncharacterized protein LOC101781348 [Setaria italica]RCV20550.1 hypothetical protein SETIT_4G065300v2 [Setaria italica]
MEHFPDGAHVRLRSRVHGTFLHADADGVGVSPSPRRASLSAAWAAHRVERGGAAYVLLRSNAYGRYLALWAPPAPRGQGRSARSPVLRVYDSPEQDDVLWVAVRARDGGDDVLLRHGRDDTSFLGVTVDSHDSRQTHWVVEAIPARQRPPILPAPVPLSRPMVLWRTISYVRADDDGNFDPRPLARRWFIFYGRSVFQLTGVLSILLRERFFGIRLCVRAGSQGRLTPLVIDLPANEQTMDIVVLTAWSSAAQGQELVYPDVDA